MNLTVDVYEVVEKVKNVLKSPREFFQASKKEKGFKKAFSYLIVISLAGSILSLVGNFLSPLKPVEQYGITGVLVFIAFTYFVGLFGSFILAFILQLLLKIFKIDKPFSSIYQIYVYSRTPGYLLGWVPYLNILVWGWGLYLLFLGLQKYFKIPQKKLILIMATIVASFVLFYLFALASYANLGLESV